MDVFPLRRLSYYATVLVGALIVHQGAFNSLIGDQATDLLRRNNEAYLLLFFPAYWDLFARRTDPDGRGGTMAVGPAWTGQATWFTALVALIGILSFEPFGKGVLGLPQSIVTLREACIAMLALSAYIGWSRSILPGPLHMIDGAPTVPATRRAVVYAALMAIVIAVWLELVGDVLGDAIGGWFGLSTEAIAGFLLIATYFDVVAPARRIWIRVAWYLLLPLVPVLVQGGVIDDRLPETVSTWIGQATEAFVAAFGISIYFDLWRSTRHRRRNTLTPDAPGRRSAPVAT
jgi:hypothetical protein